MNQNNETKETNETSETSETSETTNPKFEACRASLGRTPTSDEFLTWAYARGKEYASETGDAMPPPNQLYTVASHVFFEAWLKLNAGRLGWDACGSDSSRQQNDLVEANIGLAIQFANSHRRQGMEFDDLVQEGRIGIGTAIRKFQWHRGTAFSTYALCWVKHNVKRAIENDSTTIRVPVHVRADAKKNPTGESARLVSLSQPLSLDQPVGTCEETNLIDFIVDHKAQGAHEAVDLRIRAESIGKVLAQLTEREAQVLSLRFGLEDGKSMTLAEIGAMMGTTREYVRQVEAKALRRIRLSDAMKVLKAVA